jgi:hypothetical protein
VASLDLPMGQAVDEVVAGVGLGEGANHPPLLWATEAQILKPGGNAERADKRDETGSCGY